MRKKLLAMVLAAAMTMALLPNSTFAANFTPRTTAPSSSNEYYYSSSKNPFYAAGFRGQCTWYAWGRAYEILGSRPKLSTGNASEWYSYNQSHGYYPYGTTPKVGAIACKANHVAVVEAIQNGRPVFSESNVNSDKSFHYNRNITDIIGYIYILDSAETHQHSFTRTVFHDGMCTGPSYQEHFCSCGYSYTDNYADPPGHDFSVVKDVTQPTCTEGGGTLYACSRCGSTSYGNQVAALGHDYKDTVTLPTCLEQGYTTHTCGRCGSNYTDNVVPALGHSFSDYVYNNDATTERDGTETAKCIRGCGATDTRVAVGTKLSAPAPSPKPSDRPWVNPFLDVAPNSWFYGAVEFVSERGLMNGTSFGAFSPDAVTTRGMIMTILARLDGEDTSGGGTWYEKGMNWAVENGVSDGTRPDGTITREQLAVMLWRYLDQPERGGDLSAFPDAGSVSSWAQDAMRWAVETGVVCGQGGRLVPGGNATRAEAATMLMRFCARIDQ